MNRRTRWELVAAVSAALVIGTASGREARAEKLWTERPAELRSSPGDDSQVVKRVGKGRSLEVVKRLGTWVQVEYEGRTGWIRRTALSTEQVSGGSADAGDKEEKVAKKDKKDAKKKDSDAEEEEALADPKPAAAGAKRTAAKKKAERRKSRKSRRGSGEVVAQVDDSEDSDKIVDDGKSPKSRKSTKSKSKASAEDDEEMKPRRPRSTWGARGRIPGGPLKVEIQALSVQAFEEQDGSGRVMFTAAEGDRVRVIGRSENRWLLVDNGKKQGWIPAVAVKDHGLLLEARKDASKSDASDESEDGPIKDEEEEVEETKTASASDEEGALEDDLEEEDSGKSSDEPDTSLASTSDDEMMARPKPWTLTGGIRAGFTAVGQSVTPTGSVPQDISYNGPIAALSGEFVYKLKPKIGILAELGYDFSTALGGLTYTAEGAAPIEDIKVSQHRVGIATGLAYGKRAVGSFKLGYQYGIYQISDLANAANLPSESTSGPTVGLGFSYPELAGKLGARLGVDALLLGSRSQTDNLKDGELDSLYSLGGTAMVDYPIGKNLTLGGGYRFGYTSASWTGASQRTSQATATERTDTAHEISLGVGLRM